MSHGIKFICTIYICLHLIKRCHSFIKIVLLIHNVQVRNCLHEGIVWIYIYIKPMFHYIPALHCPISILPGLQMILPSLPYTDFYDSPTKIWCVGNHLVVTRLLQAFLYGQHDNKCLINMLNSRFSVLYLISFSSHGTNKKRQDCAYLTSFQLHFGILVII